MSPMRGLRQRVEASGYILNGNCQMPGAFSAELYARQGWDSVSLDLQHGLIGYETAVLMLQALSSSGVLPLARAPWLDPAPIMKLLDAGVLGIICPMVNTAADAERFVQYCKFAPRGIRSFGPVRASLAYGSKYAAEANDLVGTMAMIETAEAVENVDGIAAIEGLDGVYIGALDLALSMGHPPDPNNLHPDVDAAIDHILDRCNRAGLIVGMVLREPELTQAYVERGFRFLTISSDMQALSSQAKNWVQTARKSFAQAS